jgi:hypothetical protein
MESGQFAAGEGAKGLDELGIKALKWIGNAAFGAKGLKFLGKGGEKVAEGVAKSTATQLEKTALQRGAGFVGKGLTATAKCAPVIGAVVMGGMAAADNVVDAAHEVKQGNYRNAAVSTVQATTRFTGVAGGALAGAEIGAVVGSVVPGVGTVIGGVAGGIIGGLTGDWGSKKIASMINQLKNNSTVAAAQEGEQSLGRNGIVPAYQAADFRLGRASIENEKKLITQAMSRDLGRPPAVPHIGY